MTTVGMGTGVHVTMTIAHVVIAIVERAVPRMQMTTVVVRGAAELGCMALQPRAALGPAGPGVFRTSLWTIRIGTRLHSLSGL